MKYYKELLLKKLHDSGWELDEIDSETDWWLEEMWKISSTQQNWGFTLYIHFLVDPQYDGTDKSSAVWAVSAIEKPAVGYVEAQNECKIMYLQKGRFDENLDKFVGELNNLRNRT